MRRRSLASLAAVIAIGAAVLGFGAPASAASPPGSGWFSVPEDPFDRAAGVECDFPIHAQATVSEVYGKTTKTYPDGTPSQQVFVGPLVYRVTNTDNGKSYDANASGSAVVDYGTDGSQKWYVIGPILLNSHDGHSNLPRGIWVIDGVYTITFDASGHNVVTLISGSEDNVCDHIA